MTEKTPFKAISFSFNDREHGRMLVRMKFVSEEERDPHDQAYQLHIEKGPAQRCEKVVRKASLAEASSLCEQLLEAGCFGWENTYEDNPANGTSRWMLNIVFEPEVFELHSRGGSDYPLGFDAMMEAFYSIGLPSPEEKEKLCGSSAAMMPDMNSLGAVFNPQMMQGLMEQMQHMMGTGEGFDFESMQEVMRDMQANPERMQELMRLEMRSMPADLRNAWIEVLSASGLGTREFWQRFFGA